MLFGGMMVSREDIPHFRRAARSPASALRVARILASYARERLSSHRGTTLYLGNALAGRLLKSCVDLGVEIRVGQTIDAIVREPGGVRGVELAAPGARRVVRASRGVILATGGVSHEPALRARYVSKAAGELTATVGAAPEQRGARLAGAIGARLSAPGNDLAFWVPGSTFVRADGTPAVYPHTVTDRAKPGLIAVDRDGRRFVNEAVSYHDFVRAQLAAGERAIPAYLVCDGRFIWKYGLGRIKPFTLSLRSFESGGYLRRASTIEGLAAALGIPADALRATLERFNDGARRGVDPQFGRGSNVYQRHLGDADHAPNPCVAPIERSPFYAIEVRPADLGMSAGIVTDDTGRVLGEGGSPIDGLYACGNDMESFMEGAYPGPGINLGPALVFGYLAARHACARAA
jgi:succinate dehydrogenase/fumarate reductase flavoprotein subunit